MSSSAKRVEVFPHLNHNLISLGQLCDDKCTVLLDKNKLIAVQDADIKITGGTVVLEGIRSTSGDKLWDIPLPQHKSKLSSIPSSPKSINVIIRKDKSKHDLIVYLHAACFSPTKTTFINAIKKNFLTTWPGLTADLVNKHLPTSVHTAKGHIKQELQGLQSTKKNLPTIQDDMHPTSDIPNIKTNDVIYSLISSTDKGFMDLTGRFPYCSSRGNEYILIAYHYDSNAIMGRPLKNRQAATITNAWKDIHTQLQSVGLAPNTWILDNESSTTLQSAMKKKLTKYQLVPPHNHRSNAAERAIQTFKCHFKAGLSSVDVDFPIAEWDRLLEQAFLTLNLLRSSRLNPNLSAYAQVFGMFDFNATPLAPPGTKVVSHNKPATRASWDMHGSEGWYVGPALRHYRCVTCFMPETRREIVSDTVTFIPQKIVFPKVTTDDFLRQSASDIITLLTQAPPSTLPSLQAGDSTRNALLQLATILHANPLCDKTLQRMEQRTTAEAATLISQQKQHPPKPASQQTLQEALAQLARVVAKKKAPQTHASVNLSTTQFSYKHRAAEALLAYEIFGHTVNHIYDDNGKKLSLDDLLTGDNKDIWIRSTSNEIGRLAQGNIHGVQYTDTIEFIHKHEVPIGRAVTYANFVCDYRPLKQEQYRVRLVVGGDKLTYLEDAGSPAASILETKLLINSVISDALNGAKFMSADLKDFFLASPMATPENMRIHRKYIPQDIIDKYHLETKFNNDYIYVKIKKGMYGLKQAAILAYEHLVNNLKPHGYEPIPHTVGLWRHKTRKTKFCLCVDDFGIKYYSKDDAQHLLNALGQNYTYSTDWDGKNFCGLSFDWNYHKGYVDVSMPNYVKKVLHKFQHPKPYRPVYSPFPVTPWKPPKPGERQYAPSPDNSPLLDKKGITRVQSIVGSVLYYARAIDATLLPALNSIAAKQAHPTKTTERQCNRILDYLHTYPDVFVRYHASDMQLTIDSDAAYLVEPEARSRIAGYFQLNTGQKDTTFTNGAVHIECKTLRHVVASSAEAETAGAFHNCQIAIPIRHMLNELGHIQHPTIVKTDNATTFNFINNNIHQKKSKSWDMRFFWLRDREQQNQFKFHWETGKSNKADYFTKHHAETHHRTIRNLYVQDR